MSLLVRDYKTITPRLRDGAPTTGNIEALQMTQPGSYFTEPIEVETFTEGIMFAYTTAHAGTNPTLDISLQYGFRDASNQLHWIDSGDAFTQITTTDGIFIKKMTANFGKWVRLLLKIGGTSSPSYTLTIKLALKA